MTTERKHRRGTLLLGILLLGVGLVLVLAPARSGAAGWLIALWPVFLICAGVVRVMGFAVERKPRSPLGGMLLIIVGVLFLAARFEPGLNALQVYGRYWMLLLFVFAGVELIRIYSHRHSEGPAPRIFTPLSIAVILLIVLTGVFANRAANKPSVLSALKLPGFLSGLRDSVVGDAYAFTDPTIVTTDIRPDVKVVINNSYGSVRITGGSSAVRATLVKGVRGWSETEARKIADRIHLVVNQTSDNVSVTTNRDQLAEQFTTDVQIEVPSSAIVTVIDSYGSITATGVQGGLIAKASYGQADISGIRGDVNLALTYSDASVSKVDGDVTVNGARRARLSNIAGALVLTASHGSVELRDITGPVHVDAPFSRIVAAGLSQASELKTQHASVDVSHAAELTIDAPNSDVRARDIDGDLRVSSSNSDLQFGSITGDLDVQAEQSSVNADDIRGAVSIETSHGEITVRNFYESVRAETSYRDVTLIAATEPAGDIEVENNHGLIKLVLPQSSRFQLDAETENGQIQPIGFNQLDQVTRNALVASLGSNGPIIKLRTSFKNIIIQAGAARQTQTTALAN